MRLGKGIRILGLTGAMTLGLAGETLAQISIQAPAYPGFSKGTTGQFEAISTSTVPVPLQGVKTVVSGQLHTCALMLDGTVKCWGGNGTGELGNGTTQDSQTPVLVKNLNDVTAIAAGGAHTCALLSSGAVECWGNNDRGQLGSTTANPYVTSPIPVPGLAGPVVGIAAGQEHTCAIITGGSVECWGDNTYLQLGNPSYSNNLYPYPPAQVLGLSFVTSIAAGDDHTCVLEASGDVYCWGNGIAGQLGGGVEANSSTPVQSQISGGVKTKAIAARGNHTCALASSGGGVQCWGDLNSSNPYIPTPVSGVSLAKAIAAGGSQACALLVSGSVECWGYNNDGQLGYIIGTSNVNLNPPVTVNGTTGALTGVLSIAGGGEPTNPTLNQFNFNQQNPQMPAQTYAVLANGTVMAWGTLVGQNQGGGFIKASATPVQVAGNFLPNEGVRQLVSGTAHTCALMGDGTVQCWGYNSYGQLGVGFTGDSSTPVQVKNSNNMILSDVTSIGAGLYHTCALIADGSVQCWGDDAYGEAPGCSGTGCFVSHGTGVQNAIAIAAGGVHTCALIADGSVNCWGRNVRTQLCTTHLNCFSGPLSGVSQAVAITAGMSHSCALYATGGATCWGDNSYGELGNGSSGGQLLPTSVSGLGGWATWATSISAGYNYTCAVLYDGTARCWGSNAYGKLGNGSLTNSLTPAVVSNLAQAASISATYDTTCAATLTGSLDCWGWNAYGNLGNGLTANSSLPGAVPSLSAAVASSGGEYNTAALLADGTVQDWGYGAYGDLGNGTTASSLTPVATLPLTPVVWSSSNPAVLSINPSTGFAKGMATGTVLVNVTYQGQTAKTGFSVF